MVLLYSPKIHKKRNYMPKITKWSSYQRYMAHLCANQHTGSLILIGPEGSTTAGAAVGLWFQNWIEPSVIRRFMLRWCRKFRTEICWSVSEPTHLYGIGKERSPGCGGLYYINRINVLKSDWISSDMLCKTKKKCFYTWFL